jgi:hypothetical protein
VWCAFSCRCLSGPILFRGHRWQRSLTGYHNQVHVNVGSGRTPLLASPEWHRMTYVPRNDTRLIKKLFLKIAWFPKSDFRIHRDVDEICALLWYYAAPCGNPSPTFRHYVSVP